MSESPVETLEKAIGLCLIWTGRSLRNNLVESSVPQFLLRQVFYFLAGNGNAFGPLRRGERKEGVLVMLILPPFSVQALD